MGISARREFRLVAGALSDFFTPRPVSFGVFIIFKLLSFLFGSEIVRDQNFEKKKTLIARNLAQSSFHLPGG